MEIKQCINSCVSDLITYFKEAQVKSYNQHYLEHDIEKIIRQHFESLFEDYKDSLENKLEDLDRFYSALEEIHSIVNGVI